MIRLLRLVIEISYIFLSLNQCRIINSTTNYNSNSIKNNAIKYSEKYLICKSLFSDKISCKQYLYYNHENNE